MVSCLSLLVCSSHVRMSDETARVEDVLLDKAASESLVMSFVQASGVSFEGILDPSVCPSIHDQQLIR